MLCIVSDSHSARFNLAAEEYLFKNFSDDIFFLYINRPAIVVGKHQNAMAEINPLFVFENKIDVVRRLSGGGTVYHDMGNLNFSFHRTVTDTSKMSFKNFNLPIVHFLNQQSIQAYVTERNDIFVDGFKISGHAAHVLRNRVLSHGTLLYQADKEFLKAALSNTGAVYASRAIQSVRSKVANISDFVAGAVPLIDFLDELNAYMLQLSPGNSVYRFTNNDKAAIEKLSVEKYSTWEWNFGYSPPYTYEKTTPQGLVSLSVEKGIVKQASMETSQFGKAQANSFCKALIDCTHSIDSVHDAAIKANLNNELDFLVQALF